MNNIENRIEKLEKTTGADKPDRKLRFICTSEEDIQMFKDSAKRLGGSGEGWPEDVILVTSEKAKELTERIMEGK